MSIFDAGFMVWGYLALYVALTIVYLIWMVSRNRKDARGGASSSDRENGRDQA